MDPIDVQHDCGAVDIAGPRELSESLGGGTTDTAAAAVTRVGQNTANRPRSS